MKSSDKFILIILCISISTLALYSQDSIQYRKLYLHTDREHYFLGDTIWYKAYYLDGQTNKFVSGLITMYVDIFDESGKSMMKQVVPIDNGSASGAINIPNSLEPGAYMIRAFTDFQRQIGEDAFFYKQVKLSRLESFVEGKEQGSHEKNTDFEVAFLPEGGILLEGQKNTLGIKAIDKYGKGIPIQGEILDSKGESVAAFTTTYKGMTSVRFVPRKDETYTARVVSYPDFKYDFEDIVEEGIKIEFDRESANEVKFRVVTNDDSHSGKTYYFAISHRGEVIFHKKFVPTKKTFPVTVIKDALPAGINRMVLLDEQLLPISERLYFSTNFEVNEIRIRPDKQAYETRSLISLNLSDEKGIIGDSWSNLSMAVVDEFADNKEDPSMNILSWILIDSELKGHIETPLEYFSSDRGMKSNAKLDLLMMTQGWSRYIWGNPGEYLAKKSKEEEGFELTGKVKKVVGNKPVTDGTVELKVYNNDFMHMDEVEMDSMGNFIFEDVSFIDSASVFIQAKNRRDKLAFKVFLDPVFQAFPKASADYLATVGSIVPKEAELYEKQYDNLQALKEYTLKSGGYYLDEVTITESKREPDDGHFRIYSKPSTSWKLTEKDVGYLSVFEYIQSHFAGVRITTNKQVIIRGPSSFMNGFLKEDAEDLAAPPGNSLLTSGALLLIDGYPVTSAILGSIPMSDIDVVEILKNPAQTAIYGTRGGNGVVSVFTKKGGVQDYSDKYIPGTIAKKLEGYSTRREFYSPKYHDENLNSERPDHRIVQYWDPNIFTENGKASVSFFSSDDISRYKVYVEGITNNGRICLGTSEIVVDKRNTKR